MRSCMGSIVPVRGDGAVLACCPIDAAWVHAQIGSYNVNGKKPPDGLALTDWISAGKDGPGIVVVGFQEVVPLSAGNVFVGAFLAVAFGYD